MSKEDVIQFVLKKMFCSNLIWPFLSVSIPFAWRPDSLWVLITWLMRFSLGNAGVRVRLDSSGHCEEAIATKAALTPW